MSLIKRIGITSFLIIIVIVTFLSEKIVFAETDKKTSFRECEICFHPFKDVYETALRLPGEIESRFSEKIRDKIAKTSVLTDENLGLIVFTYTIKARRGSIHRKELIQYCVSLKPLGENTTLVCITSLYFSYYIAGHSLGAIDAYSRSGLNSFMESQPLDCLHYLLRKDK